MTKCSSECVFFSCVIDPILLGDIKYGKKPATAYAESWVYSYSDLSTIFFMCNIKICSEMHDDCGGTAIVSVFLFTFLVLGQPPRCDASAPASTPQQQRLLLRARQKLLRSQRSAEAETLLMQPMDLIDSSNRVTSHELVVMDLPDADQLELGNYSNSY